MELRNKKVLVVGTGISGAAAMKLLDCQGAQILVLEGNEKADREELAARLPRNIQYDLILGELPGEKMDGIALAVLSPGVPVEQPFVAELEERGVPVWGEIELAYRYSKGRLAAITGTNGKTTTTALTGAIMKEFYKEVFVVGNIGLPYTEYALETTEESVTVAEVSSFQLETVYSFRPDVSAILNITPDHLNRHHTMERYVEAKSHIAQNQGWDQVCVMNYEDPWLRELADRMPADVFWFSSQSRLERGIWLEGEEIFYREKGQETIRVCSIHDMKLLGVHNYENVMAAVGIAAHLGVPMDCIRRAVADFDGVEHRIEYVREVDGVKYYNDSKGTNPDAAIKAVQAMTAPTIVIGGGYDKQSSYEEWIASFQGKVKALVLLGETADKIEAAARQAGFQEIIRVNTLEEAVTESRNRATPGDAVLLSPACASWDMFKSFEERGDLFKEYVNKL